MSVSLCILMRRVTPVGIVGVLEALVRHNVETYASTSLQAPWEIRWRPDDFDDVVLLQDVVELQHRGYGSCGPLACAYAAWEIYQGRDAGVRLLSNGPQSWHVVAVSNGQTLDPQTIGATGHGAHS